MEFLLIIYLIIGLYVAANETPSGYMWLQKTIFKALFWPFVLLFKLFKLVYDGLRKSNKRLG